MSLENRKIKFVQDFLDIESEAVISRFESLLEAEKEGRFDQIASMTIERQHERIDRSESDFANNRFKTSSELISKYDSL
ncbi:hypothetical protein [Leeuwenhoekiella parthenopeia]|uniref:Addiction module component n=1 Tax=Leeuwenhoekiella parthenopeia TaxID=2890320 RepID=A0ABS8GW27_9FLAO|nr:hypothetical protein [Leeuwenhoekiella parthenopeia]MCC4214189.1 hypothetical protein [Leeuwenhoekiella parthenopeia]